MYSRTKEQLIEIIKENGPTSVKVFIQKVGITQAAVHRALNKLVEGGQLVKKGTAPKVFYDLAISVSSLPQVNLSEKEMAALKDHYLYIDPTGKTKDGLDGFIAWMTATRNRQSVEGCVKDYLKILDEAQSHKNKAGVIDATRRFSQIFNDSILDVIYYYDFYSLIKFGKTKMGNLLLHGKQAQNKKIINKIASTIKPKVLEIIKSEKIDAIAWIPHSIPRKVAFLPEIQKSLELSLPKIEIVKVYEGDIPVAQKSLTKIEERIKNAQETMVVVTIDIKFKNVLVIDDAVGSGATLHEVAAKLKRKGVKRIVGFSIVGSYKGFEVIKEV